MIVYGNCKTLIGTFYNKATERKKVSCSQITYKEGMPLQTFNASFIKLVSCRFRQLDHLIKI